MRAALYAIELERERQDRKWGEQNHPDGTGVQYEAMAAMSRDDCDRAHRDGEGTWVDILQEEFYEALCETDPLKLRAELIQVVAVGVAWIEAIDRRAA